MPGLTAADFEVFEDGKPQTITNFYVVEKGSVASTTAPAVNEERFRRRVLVVVDDQLIAKPRRTLLLEKLRQFIDDHFSGDYDWSIVSLGPGARTSLPSTSDRQKIHEALLAIQHAGTVPRSDPGDTRIDNYLRSRSEADLVRDNEFLGRFDILEGNFRAASTTIAVDRIAGALGAAPGKKIILLVTGGFSSATLHSMTPEAAEQAAALQKLHDAVVRDVASANVSLFILNPEGLEQDVTSGRGPTAGFSDDSGAFWMAKETGGSYFRGNRFSEELHTFDASTGNFYSLGYSLSRPEDHKYHRITVRLKHGGHYSLSYRPGYSSRSPEQQLERALMSPLGISTLSKGIPVTMSFGSTVAHGDGFVVPIVAVVPGNRLQLIPRDGHFTGRIHVYLSIFDRQGALAGFHHFASDVDTPKSDDITVSVAMPLGLPHGSYRIVITIRDDLTNEVGIAGSDLTL